MRRFLLLGIVFSLFLAPWTSASPSVVISEILYNPNGADTAGEEFVELYNPTSQAINLTDWKLEAGNGADGVWSLQATLNRTIGAFGFYLIGGALVNGTDF